MILGKNLTLRVKNHTIAESVNLIRHFNKTTSSYEQYKLINSLYRKGRRELIFLSTLSENCEKSRLQMVLSLTYFTSYSKVLFVLESLVLLR
jgi:hypothetical protein